MEDSPNDNSMQERQLGSEGPISRADLKALVGRAVRCKLASQQGGPSSVHTETGECLGGV